MTKTPSEVKGCHHVMQQLHRSAANEMDGDWLKTVRPGLSDKLGLS